MKINKEQILALVRFILTSVGVFLVANGNMDDISYQEISGSIMTAISGIWSIFDKSESQMIKKIADYQASREKL